MEDPHQQSARGHVDEHHRHLQHRDRWPEDGEQRRRQPGLQAQHVGCAVNEHRVATAFGHVLRHQAEDRLVRVEAGLLPPQEDGATCQHQQRGRGHGEDQRAFHHPQLPGAIGFAVQPHCQ